jgi:hypothetical protein
MTSLAQIARWIWPSAGKGSVHNRLDQKLNETLKAADSAVATAREVTMANTVDQREAKDLAEAIRGRVEQQAVRRTQRVRDPKVSVIMDTVKILENRR